MSSDPDSPADLDPFTQAVQRAQSGLRRDVEAMMTALEDAELLVPLARDLPDAPEGERIEFEGELTLVPHLLPDAEGHPFAVLFTYPEPLDPIVSTFGWQTDDQPLKVCAIPARLAFQMALEVVDERRVLGLVIDPGAPSELCLTRAELSSILAGRAVPLVAYVADIPEEERANTLIAEPGEPPPPELVRALERWVEQEPRVKGQRLQRTFNPDRDIEPHLTLTLQVDAESDRSQLFLKVTQALDGMVPPPGYIDVLFERSSS